MGRRAGTGDRSHGPRGGVERPAIPTAAAVTLRAGRGASPVELVRLLLAAELVGTPARVSLDPGVASVLGLLDAPMDGSAPAAVRRLHRVIDARRER